MLEERRKTTNSMASTPNVADATRSGFLNFAEKVIHLYYLIAVVLVVVVLALGVLLMITVYSNNDISSQMLTRQTMLTAKQAELSKLKASKTDYEELEKSAQKFFEALPEEAAIPSLILQLESLAGKNNLTMNNINIAEDKVALESNPTKAKSVVKKLTLTTDLAGGDYFTLKNYLADIEKNVRIMDIKSLVYSPTSHGYALTINCYYLQGQ